MELDQRPVAQRDRRVHDVVTLAAYILDFVRGHMTGTVRWRSRMSMSRRDGMTVRRTDPVHLMPARIVGVMSSGVAAGKTKERHGRHTGGSENDAEDVEVH